MVNTQTPLLAHPDNRAQFISGNHANGSCRRGDDLHGSLPQPPPLPNSLRPCKICVLILISLFYLTIFIQLIFITVFHIFCWKLD